MNEYIDYDIMPWTLRWDTIGKNLIKGGGGFRLVPLTPNDKSGLIQTSLWIVIGVGWSHDSTQLQSIRRNHFGTNKNSLHDLFWDGQSSFTSSATTYEMKRNHSIDFVWLNSNQDLQLTITIKLSGESSINIADPHSWIFSIKTFHSDLPWDKHSPRPKKYLVWSMTA